MTHLTLLRQFFGVTLRKNFIQPVFAMNYSSEGSGKAGSIREAGGAFGKLEAAREEDYFYKKQREQLKQLQKDKTADSSKVHEESIRVHEEAIAFHRKKLDETKK